MIYRIAGQRLWSTEKAKFISETEGVDAIDLYRNGRPADEAYLRRTLDFYGYPVGDELLTDEDRAEVARALRDQLLADTDYLLMPDYPIESAELEAVKTYRQALRDVPEQPGFPGAIEWPETPGEIE